MEQSGDFALLGDHQRFKGFRGDLQNPRRFTEQLPFLALRRITMPSRYGDSRFLAKLVQPPELIIDERLERSDVQHSHRSSRLFIQETQDWKKRRFGFAGGGGCRQQHIVIGIEKSITRRILHRAKRLPAGAVNIILYKRGVLSKNVHRSSAHSP